MTEGDNQFLIKPAELEIQFISATRNDDKTGRSLCRGEMLELMVRISQIKYRQIKFKQRRGKGRRGAISIMETSGEQLKTQTTQRGSLMS